MTTILYIDDEPETSEPQRCLLESQGYRVITARSGQEGLRLFQSQKIDVVISDYWMSGMNGVEIARQIKAINSSTPVIILSGLAELPGETLGIADKWIMKGQPFQAILASLAELTAG